MEAGCTSTTTSLGRPRQQFPKNAFQTLLMVSIRQSGPAVHLEAWATAGSGLRGFAPPEMGIAPGGFNGAMGRSEARARVNPLLADFGQLLTPRGLRPAASTATRAGPH